MNTDTPRTDAELEKPRDVVYLSFFSMANLARKLEHELNVSNAKVERLSQYVEMLEIFSPENEWDLPEWRRLVGSKEENENPKTLLNLYQFRIAPTPEQLAETMDNKNELKCESGHQYNYDLFDKSREYYCIHCGRRADNK
jgi:hypothetical protein